MIDAAFGDTFLFNGRMRPEAVLGVGVQKRIMRAALWPLNLRPTCSATSPNSNKAANSTRPSPMPIYPHRASARGCWESEHASGFSLG